MQCISVGYEGTYTTLVMRRPLAYNTANHNKNNSVLTHPTMADAQDNATVLAVEPRKSGPIRGPAPRVSATFKS